MNAITMRKRGDLTLFIEKVVEEDTAIQGIVVIGSVAKGTARPDSDIDAVVFLDPFDLYSVPAEAKWRPEDGSFHGIFSHVENSIQLDFKRLDLTEWSNLSFEWAESMCAELSEGWVAFDRNQEIGPMILKRTRFTDVVRQYRLDDAINHLDWLLGLGTAEQTWESLGSAVAHYRLHSAYDYLVQALFAYNRRWRTLKSRELSDLLNLQWLPQEFEEKTLLATNALSEDYAGYEQRLKILRHFFDEIMLQCQQDGLYGSRVMDEAFLRQHEEPGRDWNMAEWVKLHQERP